MKNLFSLIVLLASTLLYGADQPSQGVSVRSTNGWLWATNGTGHLAFSPTNGAVVGNFDGATVVTSAQYPSLAVTNGGFIGANFSGATLYQSALRAWNGASVLGDFTGSEIAVSAHDGGIIAGYLPLCVGSDYTAREGAVLLLRGSGPRNSTFNSFRGAFGAIRAENMTNANISVHDSSLLLAMTDNTTGSQIDATRASIIAANLGDEVSGRNNIHLSADNSIVLGAPPASYTGSFFSTVALIGPDGVVNAISTNGFTSGSNVFTKMPTNAPAVGQVITATSTAGHTKWGTAGGSTNYIYLTHPHQVDGTGATLGTNTTSLDFGHATFSHSADQTVNYAMYRFEVPANFNASYNLEARLKIRLNAGDTATHRYVLSCGSVADSAAASGTVANSVNLDFAGDASGASGDVETVGWTTLTGWSAALTAGQLCVVRLARDGDAAEDASTQTSTELGLVISYVSGP